jgi:hypothetical protein
MYLDPSFGGMLLQVIVAIAASVGVIIFGMRKKIKAFLKKNKNDTDSNVNRQAATDGEVIDMLADGESKK